MWSKLRFISKLSYLVAKIYVNKCLKLHLGFERFDRKLDRHFLFQCKHHEKRKTKIYLLLHMPELCCIIYTCTNSQQKHMYELQTCTWTLLWMHPPVCEFIVHQYISILMVSNWLFLSGFQSPLLVEFLPTLLLWTFSALLPTVVYYSDSTFIGHWTR